MKNKRGFIRILEAVFAILLLAGFLIFFIARQSERSDFGDYAYEVTRDILRDIEQNSELRNEIVVQDKTDKTEDFVRERLSDSFEFDLRICSPNSVCGLSQYIEGKDIYADSVLITSTLEQYDPKQLKLFVWRK